MKKIYLMAQIAVLLIMAGCSRKDDWQHEQLSDQKAGDRPMKTNVLGQYLGVTLGFQYSAQLTGPPTYPNQQNISLYNPDSANPNATWDSWAEQLEQAGVDFICPNLTGTQPNTNGDPSKFLPLLNTINARGLTSKIKFAIFDDNAASWTAQWNMANGRGYGYAQKFDMADQNNWKYIYDYNYKKFYDVVPDANRFKINGRPVIMIWTGNTNAFVTNMVGNASQALMYVRQKCQADFGFNPYIILSGDFFNNDPTCNNPGVADARQDWFGPPTTSYSLSTYNGVSVGVAVPQFYGPGTNVYLNPNHGQLFETGLAGTVGAGALLTLCEGFTDYEEDAAMWRARNIDANGTALSYSQTGYDYPNQRLNILRKYSSSPFPSVFKLEAEGCDSYGGAAGGNGKVNFYRNGNIAIELTSDAMGGHNVGWMQPNQWFQWEQLPFSGSPHLLLRIATPNSNMQVKVEVDGVAQATKTLPNTGGWQTWQTFDYGSLGTFANSYHKVRIIFTSGSVNFNWFQLSTTSGGQLANGTYKIINRNSGLVLEAQSQLSANGTATQQWSYGGGNHQRWTVTGLGNGEYTITGVQSGRVLEVAGQSLADGAAIKLYDYNGGANQKWTLTPTTNGYFTVKGVQSGRVLDVTGNSTAAGTLIQQWSSSGANNQQWAFQTP